MNLTFEGEPVHYDVTTRIYWFHLTAKTEDGRESAILAGASRNYIADWLHLSGSIEQEHLLAWQNQVKTDVINKGDDFFVDSAQKVFYSFTDTGHTNGLAFLSRIIG